MIYKFICPFGCSGELINGSFIKSRTLVYLTCNLCNKNVMILKEDYEKRILDYLKDERRLKEWE